MSTKIYNGYRFTCGDFHEIHESLNSFKARARELFSDRFYKVLAILPTKG